MALRLSIFLLLLLSVGSPKSYGQDQTPPGIVPPPPTGEIPPARPAPDIRVSLEGLYESWRKSMADKNLSAWEQVTALSRQIQVRNRIVSEKAPWPQAFFEDPVQAPSLGGLVALGCFSRGETASSVYFGKANFGMVDDPNQITDNLLVLHFMQDNGIWKFDNLRVVKIGNDGEMLLKIRNQDLSFLSRPEFQPDPELPPLPQPVNTPDYIAEIWITSIGYRTEVKVNGHLTARLTNASGKELVMGGLKRGLNTISIESEVLGEVRGDAQPKVEVAIYAAFKKDDIRRVYHLPSGATVQEKVNASFNVSAVQKLR